MTANLAVRDRNAEIRARIEKLQAEIDTLQALLGSTPSRRTAHAREVAELDRARARSSQSTCTLPGFSEPEPHGGFNRAVIHTNPGGEE